MSSDKCGRPCADGAVPITPVNTTTAKADTAAILPLDQALDRMEGVKDSMDKTSFYRVLGAGGAG